MLGLALVAAVSVLVATVWTQEPQGTAVPLAVAAFGAVAAALASLALLRGAEAGRSARARASRARAVRRGPLSS
ncbi:MAG: hypothetical protein HYX56_00670 [Chloroflexi bacterium]|nr:hypothetical protein [Chloroflexota bacterium]